METLDERAPATCNESLQIAHIPRAENAGKYLAETNDGRLLYLNHANQWQEMPNILRAVVKECLTTPPPPPSPKDEAMSETKLTESELAVLREMNSYPSGYPFRRATAMKLQEKGLCEVCPNDHRNRPYRRITAQGRAALSRATSGE